MLQAWHFLTCMTFIRPLSVQLQSVYCDSLRANDDAQNLMSVLEKLRCDDKHKQLYEKSVGFTNKLDIKPCKLRSARRQSHRSSVPAQSIEE